MLSRRRRYAFEFRHPSWYSSRVLKLLAENNLALCVSDHADAPAPWRRTADFVYIRGHGPSGRYKGHYSDARLTDWASHIRRWRRHDTFVYFDNDQKSAAPADALRLRAMLRQERVAT
jgi:uncharacterized protein YecE (DUF72 family)